MSTAAGDGVCLAVSSTFLYSLQKQQAFKVNMHSAQPAALFVGDWHDGMGNAQSYSSRQAEDQRLDQAYWP